nr:DUF4258 domain-containing protein [Thermococcus siculi]
MRLEERGISLDEVIHVVKSPARKFYDLKTSHLVAVGPRDTEGQWLIIAYEESEDKIEIVTVIATSKSLDKIIQNRLSSRRWIEI